MTGRVFMGRYETIRLLGEGGMGRVFLARQLDLGRYVVIKVMHDHVASDPKFRERFQRETLLMARFQHPYAVTLYDAVLDDPQGPCIIMEFIRGVTLDELLKNNHRLSPQRVGRLLGQLCEVLQAAHTEGIVHRDLKPSNLMVVDPDTPYEKIKVMDFGLAMMLDPVTLRKLSQSNAEFAVGTPGYMCPEQVRGVDMDHRGDLYSVGVILYELLTGRTPFANRCSMDALLAHATEQPPSFLEVGCQGLVSPAVESVVMSCLAKEPADRPANARELAERYEAALFDDVPVQAPAPPPEPPAAEQPAPAPAQINDPNIVVFELDAWMPEKIAAYKLRGFVEEVGGEVIESVPGRIRLRLGESGGSLTWLGIGRRSSNQLEIELYLQQNNRTRAGQLHVTVILRPTYAVAMSDPHWRKRCDQIIRHLRSYLMGSDTLAEVRA
jgi:eukaryotic-like serine/threonine-protein kinase